MKIVISDKLEKEFVDELKGFGNVVNLPANLNEELANADVLIVRSQTKVTSKLLENCKSLKLVIRAGVGLDNIDTEACKKLSIRVANTPDASTASVAELVIGLIIVVLRKIMQAHTQMKNKVWDRNKLAGKELSGKTLGLVGYGRIGRAVAERARKLGMKVIASDPNAKSDSNAEVVDLNALLAQADVISLHSVLTNETKNLINSARIGMMKDGVYIINAARGELIDEDGLYEALKSNKIAGAALDVTSKEPYDGRLLELPNVVFTSHIGASTSEAQMKVGKGVVEIVRQFVSEVQK